jgi:putative membrane protein
LSDDFDRRTPEVRNRFAVTNRQRLLFFTGLALALVLTSGPLATVASDRYVTAYLLDNVLLILVSTPLVLLGLPKTLIARVTRPVIIDRITATVTRPVFATLIFSGSFFASMVTPVVEAQAQSPLLRAGLQGGLVVAGVVMWATALRLLPGVHQLSAVGRIIFLFAQSLLPTAPTFILIFAQHPLYPIFAEHARLLGFSALGDQELAGATSKILSLFILWGTATVLIMRVGTDEERGDDPEPILWDDVEREFDRIEKRPPEVE